MHKRKNTTILIIFLLVLVVAWAILRYQYGWGTPYHARQAKKDLKNGTVQFISVGLPLASSKDAEIASLKQRYGFKTVEFGCVVTAQELNGIDQYNQIVEKWLSNRNGKGWRKAYQKSIDSLYRIAFNQAPQ